MPTNQSQWETIRKELAKGLNLTEIETIIYDLGLHSDDIQGQTTAVKLRGLIQYLNRRGQLHLLKDWIGRNRPDLSAAVASIGVARPAETVGNGFERLTSVPKTLLVDEAHGQGLWNVQSPTLGSSYALLRQTAEEELGFTVRALREDQTITHAALQDVGVFMVAQAPSNRASRLSAQEVKVLHEFVEAGRGVVVLSTYTGDPHHRGNLNDFLRKFSGLGFEASIVMPKGATSPMRHLRDIVLGYAADLPKTMNRGDQRQLLWHNLEQTTLASLSTCYVRVPQDAEGVSVIVVADPKSVVFTPTTPENAHIFPDYTEKSTRAVPLLAVWHLPGTGKVVAVGSWRTFAQRFVGVTADGSAYGNRQLFINMLTWLTTSDT